MLNSAIILLSAVLAETALAASDASCQQLLVPGYFYPTLSDPGNEWNVIAGLPYGGIIIMNPDSGPGTSANSDYTAALALVRSSGYSVIGYVYTSYGARSAAAVTSDVDAYVSFYDIDGIFFDESSSSGGDVSYYAGLVDYVHGLNSSYTAVLNFGVAPDEGYMSVADIAVTFEQTFEEYDNSYTAPSYAFQYNSSKFAHLVHTSSASQWEAALGLSFERNAGYVYITDDTMPNPWDTLPDYITEQSEGAALNCGNCNTAAVASALQWVRGQQAASGLVESFDAPSSAAWATDTAYAYDQAVASIALMLNADNSTSPDLDAVRRILAAVAENVVPDGGDSALLQVPFSWKTDTLVSSSPYRSGTAAWVAEAFALYELLTGDTTYQSTLVGIAKWLQSMLDASGSNNCVTGGPDVSWCSTEHNIDAYFALHLTSYLTGDASYDASAAVVAATLGSSLWNSAQARFKQGIDDDYRALDTQSWGSLWLLTDHGEAIDTSARVESALAFAESTFGNRQVSALNGQSVGGYGPYADASNSFQANTVWSEGTLGVALAYLRSGGVSKMRSLVREMAAITDGDGGTNYAAEETVVDNSGAVFYPYPSVAGTGWLALVCASRQEVFWASSSDTYVSSANALGTSYPTSAPTPSTATTSPSTTSASTIYAKRLLKSIETLAAVKKFERTRDRLVKATSFPAGTLSNSPSRAKTSKAKKRR